MPAANDPDVIARVLNTPATWAVVGLRNNPERTAYRISRFLMHDLGMRVIPVHPQAEIVHGNQGYASLADIPAGPVPVIDCFVNPDLVGVVVDEAIAERDRLRIETVWMQLGIIDEAAADRARAAGLEVIMDTCPKLEWPRLHRRG